MGIYIQYLPWQLFLPSCTNWNAALSWPDTVKTTKYSRLKSQEISTFSQQELLVVYGLLHDISFFLSYTGNTGMIATKWMEDILSSNCCFHRHKCRIVFHCIYKSAWKWNKTHMNISSSRKMQISSGLLLYFVQHLIHGQHHMSEISEAYNFWQWKKTVLFC